MAQAVKCRRSDQRTDRRSGKTTADLLAARDRAIADKAWIRSLMYANARNRSDDPARWSPIFTATVLDYAPASRQNAVGVR